MAHHDNHPDAHPSPNGPVFGLGDFVFILLLIAAMVAVVFSSRFAYREGMLLESAKDNAQQFVKWAEAVAAPDGKAEPFTLAMCASMPGAASQEIAAGVAPAGAAALPAGAKDAAPGAEGAAASGHGASAVSAASAVVTVAAHGTPPASAAGGHGGGAAHAGAPAPEGEHAEAPPATPPVATTWATCREALFTAGGPLSQLSNPFDATIPVASNKCERRNRATRGVVYVQKGTQPPPGVPGGTSWSPIEDDEPMVRGLTLKVQACDAGGYTINIGEVKL